ncbi:MAG: Fur family transcriptional regulator [Candidatus Marinimicrobia bacterium]|nr:Fur family transcriptional regulator [Candidatus Neomarinimicrobiota bacterium]
MITNIEHIKKTIEEHGLKPTHQRLKILEYLKEDISHPTADQIYSEMRKEIPTISKTTVYNTVNMFAEKGIVNALFLSKNELRYDGDLSFHHHFVCEECGSLNDIQDDENCKYRDVKMIDGNQINDVSVYFTGICKKCLAKKRKGDEYE